MIITGRVDLVDTLKYGDLRLLGIDPSPFRSSSTKEIKVAFIDYKKILFSRRNITPGSWICARIKEKTLSKKGEEFFLVDEEEIVIKQPAYSPEELSAAREGYYIDPYIKVFKARIVEIKGDLIVLDHTFFYPGGGGQAHDKGFISNSRVLSVFRDGNGKIVHQVDDPHGLSIGQEVLCRIDWDRRYELMKAHTAEHIFMSLIEKKTDCELVKISLDQDRKTIHIRGEISWGLLRGLEAEVNRRIQENREVSIKTMQKEEAKKIGSIRAKWDRIKDEQLRIVEIKGFDIAACKGLHVQNTREIGAFCIERITKDPGECGYVIYFEVGEKALTKSITTASYLKEVMYVLNTSQEQVLKTLINMKKDEEKYKHYLKELSMVLLKDLKPEKMNGYDLWIMHVPYISDGVLKKWIKEKTSEKDSIIIFLVGDEDLLVYIACSRNVSLDCGKVLKSITSKGGGHSTFAFGKLEVKDKNPVDKLLEIRELVKAKIKSSMGESNG